ncbi:hypothetical protein KY495_09800 [Massilia sp. PAMC28688]|uniref:T6SS effector BTH_I2691 family protein n=1 Tax=Massilia sp. PAMC28688 TaxID=2861283 RepID=UPI001C62F9F6|nr:T6SS effector BTH_I2691 family protein [Massilia sp. PAMC28688]QYF95412.1 hypothetical protein KY495_09800 [Massilia sp. PAMC28688]
MTTPTAPAKKCEFCDKRGLPLLLVRDAVAPHGGGAPVTADPDMELGAGAAHYTKRILRSGYVYLYDEARKRWENYFVTPDGYFFKLMQTPGVVPVVPAKPFNCPDEGHRELASCITIADPRNATKVWIGFSDVRWTPAVQKLHDDPAMRSRHMLAIDVKAALGGGKVAGTRPISQLSAIVAEYAMDAKKGAALFQWTPFKFDARHGQADKLKRACDQMRPGKGLIATLPDPAGLAQELALLMKRNADLFTSKPAFQRNVMASAAIDQIERAVRVEGELDEISGAEKMANEQLVNNPIGNWLFESQRQQTEQLRNVTPAEAKRAANGAWQKYAKKFKDADRKAWMQAFNTQLSAFDKQYIAPLARSHAAVMQSDAMHNYFVCNYDPQHVESGTVYTTVVTRCIASTQDKAACSKLYDKWLEGDASDTRNFLMRALLLNQKTTVDAIKKAVEVAIDWRQIPWDNLFATYTNAVGQVQGGAVADSLAGLMVQTAGPFARALGKLADGTPRYRAFLMSIGLVSGHPVVRCEVTGGRKKFRAKLIQEIKKASGQPISENKLKAAVAAELKRQNIHGARIDGTTKKHWLVLADREMIKAMPAGLTPNQRADWLARSIRTVEAVDQINLTRWRTVINTNFRLGVITGMLQAVSLWKLVEDEEKALAHDSDDARYRMYAGVTALGATMAEVFGNALAARAAQGLRFGQGIAASGGAMLARFAGRAGIATGLVVAGLDGMQAYSEYKSGADGLIVATYAASAVVGAALTISIAVAAGAAAGSALAALAIPVIGVLVALLIGLGIFLEYIKDNKVQDWLERCPWGILEGERYKDMKTEQAQLELAVKGDD